MQGIVGHLQPGPRQVRHRIDTAGSGRTGTALSRLAMPLCTLLGTLFLAACESGGWRDLPPPGHPTAGLDPDSAFEHLVRNSPHGTAPDREIMALDDSARAWLAEHVGYGRPEADAVQRLVTLFDADGALSLAYDQTETLDALGTFRERRGNCLSFTTLFIAMARDLGIQAYYQEVYIPEDWSRVGSVLALNRHITATSHVANWRDGRSIPGPRTIEVDFGNLGLGSGRLAHRVSDQRARALHFNNLGAEAIARGDHAAAVPLLNRALLLAPRMAFAWANLGTALRRTGDAAAAELAYRTALHHDPDELTALTNLAHLFREAGRPALAAAYGQLVGRYRERNPYHQLWAGKRALRNGQVDRAIALLRRAVRAKPAEPGFHFALGEAYLQQGRIDQAAEAMVMATRLAEDPVQARSYATAMAELDIVVPGISDGSSALD